jgi:hypothetical protein
MSYTDQELYNLSAYIQCHLAQSGASIAYKLKYKDICLQEKFNFILSMIYKKLIMNYNVSSCISEDDLDSMISFVRKYLSETSYHNNNCNC